MQDPQKTIERNDWKSLIQNFLPITISISFSFSECMQIIGNLKIAASNLGSELIADHMRDYAINLMIILREKHPEEWNQDWKNEAYLGISCGMLYREEEALKYLKNAYQQFKVPPQSLVFAYLSACDTCEPLLSLEEMHKLTTQAIDQNITYEGALRMATLAYLKEDEETQRFWKEKAKEAEKEKKHTPMIVPNVLKNLFKQ